MSAYGLFLHADAAAFFHSLRREEKEPLRRFLDVLEQYPTTEGEATERDSIGRTVQVKFAGGLKVIYGADRQPIECPDRDILLVGDAANEVDSPRQTAALNLYSQT